jgi:hypothetical protein
MSEPESERDDENQDWLQGDADEESMFDDTQPDLEPESNPETADMDLEAMAAELAMDTDADGDVVGQKSPDLDAIESELAAVGTTDESDASDGLDDSDVGVARYKAVAPGVIRKESDMGSDKVGKLQEGEIIQVTETETVSTGTVRVHFDRGWASLNAKNGKVLLEKLD